MGIFVQPSRKPCSLSHSRGVRRRMSRPLRTGWMELRELPEVPFWSVPHRSPFSLALRQSNPATSMTRSVASLYCRVLCVLTTSDRHSVYARQRVDQFRDDEIASTESARQHKDATDLVCQPVSTWDADCRNLIRRLTPLECERLQGYPDGWTDVPGASDSARYKALGNSVYLIMVVMRRTDVKTAPGEDSWRSCFT